MNLDDPRHSLIEAVARAIWEVDHRSWDRDSGWGPGPLERQLVMKQAEAALNVRRGFQGHDPR